MTKRHAEDELIADGIASPAPKKGRFDKRDSGMNGVGAELPHRARNGELVPAEDDSDEEEDDSDESSMEEGEEEEEDEDDDMMDDIVPTRQKAPTEGYQDLYLDTIDRSSLDFDFEKLCSISLSNINVYACLICGRYFQGRGPKSHAYFHALEVSHHIFINMETLKVYALPEGYEVQNASLNDIKFVVDPRYTKEQVGKLDKEETVGWDLLGKKYVPGFVGMNNIKDNDFFNVILQSLTHVSPLRNFLMLEDLSSKPELVKRLSILTRKIWNPRAFKSHVSPHELLQEVSLRSNKKFNLTAQSDPAEFLSWFLNNIHLALGGSKTKPGSSIIQKVFQGKLKVESQKMRERADLARDQLRFEETMDIKTDITRFMMLTLDLPPAPLFQSDDPERNIIPQVALSNILSKYDGVRSQELTGFRRRYRLMHPLPPYLIFHIKRFSANKFLLNERNPTIVTFPTNSLDMSTYTEPNPQLHPPGEPLLYDLMANITHEAVRKAGEEEATGEKGKSVWKVQLRDKTCDEWWQIQDLFLSKIQKEILYLGESYIQIWERRSSAKKKGAEKRW